MNDHDKWVLRRIFNFAGFTGIFIFILQGPLKVVAIGMFLAMLGAAFSVWFDKKKPWKEIDVSERDYRHPKLADKCGSCVWFEHMKLTNYGWCCKSDKFEFAMTIVPRKEDVVNEVDNRCGDYRNVNKIGGDGDKQDD